MLSNDVYTHKGGQWYLNGKLLDPEDMMIKDDVNYTRLYVHRILTTDGLAAPESIEIIAKCLSSYEQLAKVSIDYPHLAIASQSKDFLESLVKFGYILK